MASHLYPWRRRSWKEQPGRGQQLLSYQALRLRLGYTTGRAPLLGMPLGPLQASLKQMHCLYRGSA